MSPGRCESRLLAGERSPATVRERRLAAVNLATSMRGPTRVGKRSKTPVLMFNKNSVNSLDQHQCEHPQDRYTQGRPLRGRWRARLLVRCRLFAASPLLCVIAGKLAAFRRRSTTKPWHDRIAYDFGWASTSNTAPSRQSTRPARSGVPARRSAHTGSARSAGFCATAADVLQCASAVPLPAKPGAD